MHFVNYSLLIAHYTLLIAIFTAPQTGANSGCISLIFGKCFFAAFFNSTASSFSSVSNEPIIAIVYFCFFKGIKCVSRFSAASFIIPIDTLSPFSAQRKTCLVNFDISKLRCYTCFMIFASSMPNSFFITTASFSACSLLS